TEAEAGRAHHQDAGLVGRRIAAGHWLVGAVRPKPRKLSAGTRAQVRNHVCCRAMSDYDLVSPDDAVTLAAYHEIRRRVLFEARGRYGVYDPHRPDETAPGHFPRLLLYAGDPIGVVRIDVAGSTAILRRVAIRADVQRRGHGRMLIALVEQFAKANR